MFKSGLWHYSYYFKAVFGMMLALYGKGFSEKLECMENADCCAYLKKGENHSTCDDVAFAHYDESNRYVLAGVFDGVSGASFGYEAAEKAMAAVKAFVSRKFGRMENSKILEAAIEDANFEISRGGTTASVFLVLAGGDYFYANVGDSHIYKISEGKAVRLTKDEKEAAGSTFNSYISTRNIVIQTLGYLIRKIDLGTGRLKKGDALFAASDGVCDNLQILVEGGAVTDISGNSDIAGIIKGRKSPSAILGALSIEIKKRIIVKEEQINGNLFLVPKDDDVSMVLLKY